MKSDPVCLPCWLNTVREDYYTDSRDAFAAMFLMFFPLSMRACSGHQEVSTRPSLCREIVCSKYTDTYKKRLVFLDILYTNGYEQQ